MAPSWASPSKRLTLEFGGGLAEIADLATQVEAFCVAHQIGDDIAHAVNLSLDELLTNTLTYGAEGVEQLQVEIVLSLDDAALTTQIWDTGLAFDPSEVPEPDLEADVDDRPIGGLGVFLVREMMDDMRYQRVDGRNEVTLIKRLQPAAPDTE